MNILRSALIGAGTLLSILLGLSILVGSVVLGIYLSTIIHPIASIIIVVTLLGAIGGALVEVINEIERI